MLRNKDLLNLIQNSKITAIGSTSAYEDVLLNFVNHFSQDRYGMDDIKSIKRDFKIDQILENSPQSTHIVIDLTNYSVFEKKREREMMNYMRQIPYNFIIIVKCYKIPSTNIRNDELIIKTTMNQEILYGSDTALIIDEDKIKCIKNRFGNNFETSIYENFSK